MLPLLEEQLQANLFFNVERTTLFLQNTNKESISPYRGLIKQGELIITKNSIITNDTYQKLLSFEDAYEEQVGSTEPYSTVFVGYLLLIILVVYIFNLYLRRFAPFVYGRNPRLLFVLMWLILYSYFVYLAENIDVISPYIIPFCIVPIVIKNVF